MSEQAEKGEWPTSDIPNTWKWVGFSEFFRDSTDSLRKIPKKNYLREGKYQVIDQGEEQIGGFFNDSTFVSKANLPCIIWGDHTKCVKLIEDKFIQGADGVKVLEPTYAIDPFFAYRALQTVHLPDKGYSRHFKFLRSTQFPVPPLPEQRRIVAKLDSLCARSKAARDELARIPLLVEHYKQAILEKAFSGELTADWRRAQLSSTPVDEFLGKVRHERQQRWKNDEKRKENVSSLHKLSCRWRSKYAEHEGIGLPGSLAQLPESWKWVSVDQLAWKVVDGVHKKPNYVDNGIPFVTVKNLTSDDGINLNNLNHITDSDHVQFCLRANPEKGDILISKDGTLGVVRAIDFEPNFSIFVSVALVKPAAVEMSAYLEWAFRSPQVQEQMIGVGTGLQHIHLTDLRKDFIPVAPPEEQKEIVRRIEETTIWLKAMEEETRKGTLLLDHLDHGLLAKAFRGELVPQNPDDEPAEMLLERIRAERKSQPKPKRGRKKKAA